MEEPKQNKMENTKIETSWSGKVWNAGTGTKVITIPKNIQEFYNVEENDLVEVRAIIHKAKNKPSGKKEETKLNHSQTETKDESSKSKFNIN